MYVDKNGHYIPQRFIFADGGWLYQYVGRSKFKHIESAHRAINKFIQ